MRIFPSSDYNKQMPLSDQHLAKDINNPAAQERQGAQRISGRILLPEEALALDALPKANQNLQKNTDKTAAPKKPSILSQCLQLVGMILNLILSKIFGLPTPRPDPTPPKPDPTPPKPDPTPPRPTPVSLLEPGAPVLSAIAEAYSEGVNAKEYKFALEAINSSPALLTMIKSSQASLRTNGQGLFYQPSGNFVNIEKSFIDQSYKTSQASPSQGATDFLAAVGHEFGHAVFQTQTKFPAESEKRVQALISRFSKEGVGLNSSSAQKFVDEMNTERALTEGYAAIMAFNTLLGAKKGSLADVEKEFPELHNRLLKSAKIVPNSDGTITPTAENTLASAKEVVKSAFYRNVWAPQVLPYLRSYVRTGEVIKLSGYSNNSDGQDFSSTLAAARFRSTGEADTFVAI